MFDKRYLITLIINFIVISIEIDAWSIWKMQKLPERRRLWQTNENRSQESNDPETHMLQMSALQNVRLGHNNREKRRKFIVYRSIVRLLTNEKMKESNDKAI